MLEHSQAPLPRLGEEAGVMGPYYRRGIKFAFFLHYYII